MRRYSFLGSSKRSHLRRPVASHTNKRAALYLFLIFVLYVVCVIVSASKAHANQYIYGAKLEVKFRVIPMEDSTSNPSREFLQNTDKYWKIGLPTKTNEIFRVLEMPDSIYSKYVSVFYDTVTVYDTVFVDKPDLLGGVKLFWTAPNENGSSGGSSSKYYVRYSTQIPTDFDQWWDSAISVDSVCSPSDPGNRDTVFIGGLSVDSLYFFCVRSGDEEGNLSDASNMISLVPEDVE
jgi:hypothetical protein